MNELSIGREPLIIVELRQPACSLRCGILPCETVITNPSKKCYNTLKTCKSLHNFNSDDTIIWRFCKPDVNMIDVIPSLVSVSTTPTKINIGGGNDAESPFGRRATCSITLSDHPSDDSKDYYLQERGFNSLVKGTFWGKFLARNPYYANWIINIYEGYRGQTLEQMQVRTYLIDKITGPDSSGKVTITAKDPLRLGDDKRALAPTPSDGRLAVNITATQTIGIIIENSENEILKKHGNTDLYYIRIGDEIISYTDAVQDETLYTLIGVTRASLGTENSAHDINDDAQRIISYVNYPCWRVAYELLINYTNIPCEYIPIDEWDIEGNTWLNTFNITGIIEEPESVNDILGEITEQCLFYIWWDERVKKIKMKAIRPEIEEAYPINDYNNIIKNSVTIREDPAQRISRIIVYFNRKNPTEDRESIGNYSNAILRIDGDSEFAYGESRIKRIYSRWLSTDTQSHQLTVRLLERYRLTPKYITLKLDAKDRKIDVGSVIALNTMNIQDIYGDNIETAYQIISINEATQGETINVELQSFEFFEADRYGFYTYPDTLNYGDYTPDERIGKAFYSDEDGTINGEKPNLYS